MRKTQVLPFKGTACPAMDTLMQTHLSVQVVVPEVMHRLAIQQHLALLRTVEVFQQTHAGALPAA